MLPSELAKAVHKWPIDAFLRLPKVIRLKCCAAVPSRFRATLVPLIERWFTNIAPLVRRALKKTPRAPPVRIGSLARRAVDQLLYTALYEIIGYDDGMLLDTFALIVWRGIKRDAALGRASLFLVLYVDILLGVKLQSTSTARRVATVLDSAVTDGSWDESTLSRLKTALKLARAARMRCHKTDMLDEGRGFKTLPHQKLQTNLERAWKHLQKADKSKLFAFPVTNTIAPGYLSVILCPRDLSTMRSKIGRVNDPYDSFRALELAIKIMIENCKIFNGPGSTYAHDADTLWLAWLHFKAAEKLDVESTHTTSSLVNKSIIGLDMNIQKMTSTTQTCRLSLALVLCEPISARIASYDLCVDLEFCHKHHILPSRIPRLLKLHQVMLVHVFARNALGVDKVPAQALSMNVLIHAPKFLGRALRSANDHMQPPLTRDAYEQHYWPCSPNSMSGTLSGLYACSAVSPL